VCRRQGDQELGINRAEISVLAIEVMQGKAEFYANLQRRGYVIRLSPFRFGRI